MKGSYNLLVEEIRIIHPLAIIRQHIVIHQAIIRYSLSASMSQLNSLEQYICIAQIVVLNYGHLPGLRLELLVDSLLPGEVISVVTHLLFISNFILL